MAKALKKTLQKAQKMGRRGDTILAHITPEEARLLKARGGAGTRNPRTGLLEFDPGGGTSYAGGEYEDEDEEEEEKSTTQTDIFGNPVPSGTDPTKTYAPTDASTTDTTTTDTTTTSSTDNTPVVNTPEPEPVDPREEAINALRAELKDWGGTTEQIDTLLDDIVASGKGDNTVTIGGITVNPSVVSSLVNVNQPQISTEDLTTLTQTLKDVPQEDRMVYLIDNFGGADGVLKEWGGAGGTQAIPLNDETRASESQKPQEQRLQEAVDRQVLGSSTGEGLTPNDDGSFTDEATGTTYYRAEDGKLTDRDGNVRYDPGTGLAAEIEYNRKQQSLAEQGLYGDQGVVSDIQQTATDYETFADKTRASLDDPRNDFASQITGEINAFLNGKGGGKGFLDYQADLLGAGDTFKRQMGILSQQYDAAYAQNQTDIGRLRGEYNALTTDYASDLDPLRKDLAGVRDRLGDVSAGQMQVAQDAGDETYYGRLKNLYYADARDNIDSSVDNARDALQSNFAAAGADPNSPAYTAAIMDLQQNRTNALQSARRQALLDSYGLGSQMLGNRSQALSGAGAALGAEGSAIGAEMGALDSLYGMKSAGLQADANLTGQQMQNRMNRLNTRGDMIGNMYNIDRTNAQTGMEGLNTVLNANTNAINAKSNQFYKNIGLESDLYSGQMDMLGKSANAVGNQLSYFGGQKDKAFNTLIEANQGQKSDAYLYGTLQELYEKNNMEMPDFVNNAFGK